MQLVACAEDSRNLLMLSQKKNLKFVIDRPVDWLGKIVSGSSSKEINSRIGDIRESLCAVNIVSFIETMSYQELGEYEVARKSFVYYADFIEDTYLSVPGLANRLDSIDPSPENYWLKTLPIISKKLKNSQ